MDFPTDSNLYIACLILEKQIKHINDNKKGIIIPSESMQQHKEQAMKEYAGTITILPPRNVFDNLFFSIVQRYFHENKQKYRRNQKFLILAFSVGKKKNN